MASERSGVDVDLEQRGAWAGMLYTDRGVYRPGESIKLAGVFRRVDAAGIKVVPDEVVRVAVTDAEGETVFDGRAALDAFGQIVLDVPIPKTSHLGQARIAASVGRKDGESFEQQVLLAAYKASEFKVGVDPDKNEYVRGDAARFDVHAEYLFGAPMGTAPLHNHMSRAAAPFAPPHSEGFVTSDEANVFDHPETNPNAGELRVDDGALDDDGRFAATVNARPAAQARPRDGHLRDRGGRPDPPDRGATRGGARAPCGRLSRTRAPDLPLSRGGRRGAGEGRRVRSEPAPGSRARRRSSVELVRRTWTSVVEDEAAAVPRRRSNVVDDVVGTCAVTTAAAVASCSLRVKEPGYYILRVRANDARGNDVGASTSFYSVDDRSDAPATPVAWADPEARGLKLETDKKQYETGDVAKVLVRNPFKEADALVTVERAGVLWSRVVTLKGPMPVVEVPVSAQYFPNAFVAVHLVRGRVQDPPNEGADLGAPDFRMGVAPIEVNPETHRLKVSVATDRKEYRPGDEVDADVAVTDKGGPVGARRGDVLRWSTRAILMLTSATQTPDPSLPPFTADQRLLPAAFFAREPRSARADLADEERRAHPAAGLRVRRDQSRRQGRQRRRRRRPGRSRRLQDHRVLRRGACDLERRQDAL